MKIKIKNPIFGVPITIIDKVADDGFIHCSRNEEDIKFEIVTFRKGNDGQDLVFTREREKEFNLTFVSFFDKYPRDDKKCRRKSEWENYLCKNASAKSKIKEPIDYFFPLTTNLKNTMINDQTINGKKGYCRILIKKYEN